MIMEFVRFRTRLGVIALAMVVAVVGLTTLSCGSGDSADEGASRSGTSTTGATASDQGADVGGDNGGLAVQDGATLLSPEQLCSGMDLAAVAEIVGVEAADITAREGAAIDPDRTATCIFTWKSGPGSAAMFNVTDHSDVGVIVDYLDLVTNGGAGADLVGEPPVVLFDAMVEALGSTTDGSVKWLDVAGGRAALGTIPYERIVMRPGEPVPSAVMLASGHLFSIELIEVGQESEAVLGSDELARLVELTADMFSR